MVASLPQAAALAVSDPQHVAGPLAVTLAFGALYLAAGLAIQLRSAAARLDRLAGALVLLSLAVSLFSSLILLEGGAETAAFLVVAAVYTGLAVGLFVRDRELAAVLAVAALTLTAVGVANALDGPSLVAVWAAEAVGLAFLAGRVRDLRYAGGAFVYLLLAGGHALMLDAPPDHLYTDVLHPADGVAAPIAVLVALLGVAAAARTWRDADGNGIAERLVAPLARERGAIAAGARLGRRRARCVLGRARDRRARRRLRLGPRRRRRPLGGRRRRDPRGRGGPAAHRPAARRRRLARRRDRAPPLVRAPDARASAARLGGARTWPCPSSPPRYVAGLVRERSFEAPVGVLLSGGLGAIAAVQLAPDGHPTGYSLLGAAAAYGLLAATVFAPALAS